MNISIHHHHHHQQQQEPISHHQADNNSAELFLLAFEDSHHSSTNTTTTTTSTTTNTTSNNNSPTVSPYPTNKEKVRMMSSSRPSMPEKRKSMRLTLPADEPKETNWLLMVFDPEVSNMNEEAEEEW
jgi:hypothetical protein